MWGSLITNMANNKSEYPSVDGNVFALTAEIRCNFNTLLEYDVANCASAIFIDDDTEEEKAY